MDSLVTDLPESRATFQRQQPKWLGIAKDLAEAFSYPIAEVEQLLCTEAHLLEQEARIKEFIPTLAVKRVKELQRPKPALLITSNCSTQPLRLLQPPPTIRLPARLPMPFSIRPSRRLPVQCAHGSELTESEPGGS
jgi:hypothetical protein